MAEQVKVLIVERNGVELDYQEEYELNAVSTHTGLQHAKVIVAGSAVYPQSFSNLCHISGNPIKRVVQ